MGKLDKYNLREMKEYFNNSRYGLRDSNHNDRLRDLGLPPSTFQSNVLKRINKLESDLSRYEEDEE